MRNGLRLSLLLLSSLGVLAGCRRAGAEAEKEGENKEPIPVETSPVQMANFERTVRTIGACAPLPGRLSLIGPTLEGAVLELPAAEGQRVKSGSPERPSRARGPRGGSSRPRWPSSRLRPASRSGAWQTWRWTAPAWRPRWPPSCSSASSP
jgi:hypothetical protein